MFDIFWDIVGKTVDVEQILEFADFATQNSSQLFIYCSDIEKNIVTKIKRKKLSNIKFIKVNKDVSSDQTVKSFIIEHSSINVILVKRFANNVQIQTLQSMIEKHNAGSKIVTASDIKEDSYWGKIKRQIKNIFFTLTYNLQTFYGKGQVILFDKSLVLSMKELPTSVIKMTKVDNYRLVDRQNVFQENLKIKTNFKSKKKDLRFYLGYSILIILGLVFGFTLGFIPSLRTVLYVMPMSLMILLVLCFCFLFTTSFALYKNVGELADNQIKIKEEIL